MGSLMWAIKIFISGKRSVNGIDAFCHLKHFDGVFTKVWCEGREDYSRIGRQGYGSDPAMQFG
jgi:hypothetical protein